MRRPRQVPQFGCRRDVEVAPSNVIPEKPRHRALEDKVICSFSSLATELTYVVVEDVLRKQVSLAVDAVVEQQPTEETYPRRSATFPYKGVYVAAHTSRSGSSVYRYCVQAVQGVLVFGDPLVRPCVQDSVVKQRIDNDQLLLSLPGKPGD